MSIIQRRYAEGAWLTPSLVRYTSALSLCISFSALAFLAVTANGTVDIAGRPLGTDFSSFWSAGRLAIGGAAPQAYNWEILREAQWQAHGSQLFYPWSYPPLFLIVAALLAFLPYTAALILWQMATLLAAIVVFRVILPGRLALLAGLGYPIVFICLGHGQTGFLTAALFVSAICALPHKEVVAGVLFGLLAYKPHFGLLIPLVLAAGGYWRAFFSAGLTVLLAIGFSLALWGWPIWQAFLASVEATQTIVLESGGGGLEKFQSVFAWIRLWGGGVSMAYGGQLLVAVPTVIFCAWTWRQDVDTRLKGAALLTGTLLSVPYVLDYDLVVLGMSLALLVAHNLEYGFQPWEKTTLALAWLLPGCARPFAQIAPLPVGLLSILAVFIFILTHVRSQVAPRMPTKAAGASVST